MPRKQRRRSQQRASSAADPNVEAGIRKIILLHKLGSDPERERHRSELLVGKKDSTKIEYIEKAKHFADPDRGGYGPGELDKLIAQCRKHGFAIGLLNVFRLIYIRDRDERAKIQEQMIREHWRRGQMDAVLHVDGRKRMKTPGRPLREPINFEDALQMLTKASAHFLRALSAGLGKATSHKDKKRLKRELQVHQAAIVQAAQPKKEFPESNKPERQLKGKPSVQPSTGKTSSVPKRLVRGRWSKLSDLGNWDH